MRVFLSGGAKNGKSGYAQHLAVQLAQGGKHYYVATMIPVDEEDRERIRHHIADRAGMGFETIECGTDILSCLNRQSRRAHSSWTVSPLCCKTPCSPRRRAMPLIWKARIGVPPMWRNLPGGLPMR